jgi:hypothetical protein
MPGDGAVRDVMVPGAAADVEDLVVWLDVGEEEGRAFGRGAGGVGSV